MFDPKAINSLLQLLEQLNPTNTAELGEKFGKIMLQSKKTQQSSQIAL